MQLDRSRFKNEEKKLKKKYKEQENFEKILIFIKQSRNLEVLKSNPISYLYGFEALKEDLTNFYSFNLERSRGTTRLICSFTPDGKIAFLEYISIKHYEDFKKYLRESKGVRLNHDKSKI